MDIIKPAACIVIAASGCAAVQEAAENAQPQPRDGFELEQILASGSFSQSKIRLIRGSSDYFRVLHTETDAGTETLAGARMPVNFPFYTGNVELFGQTTESNDAVGINIDGKVIIPQLGDVLLGIAMERDNQAGDVSNLRAFYLGKEFENDLIVKLGLANVEGVAEYVAHVNRMWGRNVAGASLTLDENSEGFATVVYGRTYDGERGNGFGCRCWISTDFDRGRTVDTIFTTNTTISSGTALAPMDLIDARHDQSIFPNVMDYVSGDPTMLSERIAPGGVAVRLKYEGTEILDSGLVAVRYNFQGNVYPMLGLDWNMDRQLGDDTVHSATPRIGIAGKNGVVDYGCTLQEGSKPVHEIVASVAFTF